MKTLDKRPYDYKDYVRDSLARQETYFPTEKETWQHKRKEIEQQQPEEKEIHELEQIPVLRELSLKKFKKKLKFSIVYKVVIVFILGLFVILRFSQISELSYKTNSLKAENEKIIKENNNLMVNIEKEINLPQIREIAETRLNLGPPNESQTIYINASGTDKIDYWEENEAEEKGAFQSIIDWIKGLFWLDE